MPQRSGLVMLLTLIGALLAMLRMEVPAQAGPPTSNVLCEERCWLLYPAEHLLQHTSSKLRISPSRTPRCFWYR